MIIYETHCNFFRTINCENKIFHTFKSPDIKYETRNTKSDVLSFNHRCIRFYSF